MADETLYQFVKDALASGKSRNDIATALLAAGWGQDQVTEALNAFADIDFPMPVPRPRQYGSAREAFLYIVYFALLGMVAIYIGRLSFAWIEYAFADELAQQSWWRSGMNGLRWGIASLVVGYPVFLFLGWRLGAQRRKDPARRRSRIRAWLTYVTLIFAAMTLIGDLVAVVYQFLAGGLGTRFILKAGVVGVISGAILWNYSRDVERTAAGIDIPGRALAIVASLAAGLLVIWAFTVVKSPGAARAKSADERRIDDLTTIVRLVDCHRSYVGETPPDLAVMDAQLTAELKTAPVAPGCQAELPVEPLSGAPYRYLRGEGDQYQICIAFERGWPDTDRPNADRTDNDRRRRLGRFYGADRDARYIDLPAAGGEACFSFTARSFLGEDDASGGVTE